MKKGIVILILLIDYLAAKTQPKPFNLYFITIGNANYSDQENFTTADDINYSSDRVYNILSQYGTGIKLNSSKENLITKKLLIAKLDTFFMKAFADSNAVLIAYYCGHGQSDFDNNLYLIPGDYKYSNKINKKETYFSLIKLVDVYASYMKAANYIPLNLESINTGTEKLQGAIIRAIINEVTAIKLRKKEQKIIDEGKNQIDSLFPEFKLDMFPKLFFLADCCYDNFDINKSSYYSYGTSITKSFPSDSATVNNNSNDSLSSEYDSVYGKDWVVDITTRVIGDLFWHTGSRVIYSSKPGSVATMVDEPGKRKKHHKQVGPIARRLVKFFNSKFTFNIDQLMIMLAAPAFDDITHPCLLENQIRMVPKIGK